MAPKTKKLFISYRSLDSAKVDKLVARLRAITDGGGNPIYDVWQDKTHIVSGQNWWDQIVNGIIGCEIFLYMVSREAVQSPICAAELSYARKRNRPIVPIVLEGEFLHNMNTGKNDLDYWNLIPQELNDMQAQLLFYEGAGWLKELETAVATFAATPYSWTDIPAAKPQDPRSANDATNNPETLYARACEAAEKLDINQADTLFLRLVNGDSRYQQYAREWVELLRAYDELMRLESDRYLEFELPAQWELYQRQFPKKFVTLFDPKDFKSRYGNGTHQIAVHQPTVQVAAAPITPAPIVTPPKPLRPTGSDLMPAPLEWIKIPGKGYSISKYPITNAQFDIFKRDNGYLNSEWWFQAGWQERNNKKWKSPRFWHDPRWNNPSLPVVGVSWYEAVAFAHWLSRKLNVRIELPTEEQWKYAAQRDTNHPYPWGAVWNPERCNNSAGNTSWGQTSPVTQYEHKGDSPFGVVDMLGNVWEWCMEWDKEKKPLRGGCWRSKTLNIQKRTERQPVLRSSMWGFRLVKYYT